MPKDYEGTSSQVHSGGGEQGSDSCAHEEERQQGVARKSSDVVGQTPMGHPVYSPAADGSEPPNQAEGGQRVPHSSALQDGFPFLTVFNAVLAFAAVAGLIFTGLQLKVAQGQLEQASIANTKVNDALRVANRQAEAAETANKLNMEALSASDRPWIGVVATSPVAVDPNSNYDITVGIKNYGKTPAIGVRGLHRVEIISVGQEYPKIDLIADLPTFSVFPENNLASFLTLDKGKVAESNDDIKSAKKAIIVLSSIEYKDINARSHRSYSCSMLVFTRNAFGYCPGFVEILD